MAHHKPYAICGKSHSFLNGPHENAALKEATIKRYHYDSHDQLREHLAAFLKQRSAEPGQTIQTGSDTTQPTSPRD